MSSARQHSIPVTTHGRFLVDVPETPGPHPLLMGFHGYAESAAVHLPQLARLDPRHEWLRVSVQGLHRFYTRGQDVVASWMTREDREQAIADNVAYAKAAVDEVHHTYAVRSPLVVVGFSQGAAQAYRAGLALGDACAGVIVLGGDLPPDVAPEASRLPPVLVGAGSADQWYAPAALAADAATLRAARVHTSVCSFDGGHEWAQPFVDAAARWLALRLVR